MLGGEDEKPLSGVTRKPYLRSVSWTDRSPTKPLPKPQPGGKGRSGLPPLSITRRPAEEWPRAGSDDLGVWPNPQTPRGCGNGSGNSGVDREFEFKRDKLAFFDKECSRIADHIYLGSDAVAKNREILRQNGITHVLNCVGFVCPEYFKSDLVYKTLWLHDSPSEDITSILYDVFDYFEEVREQGGRVLVHCYQGVSRSTSLVIAYLMWREGQSFEDAFQFVKTARGVTNPNMGFACQLLQCQKRVHAMPASPNSTLRVYRMAPHSSYDPLHLVPKMLNNPGVKGLDSRGAFIVYIPCAIYVWIGKNCRSVMSNSAGVAANQVIRYERAKGPIITIKEGEEPMDFWEALSGGQLLAGGSDKPQVNKVDEYDRDFELFYKALAGGVVPPFSVSNSELETRLPARENGWGRLRQKFASGIMKEFFSSSKLSFAVKPTSDQADMVVDAQEDLQDNVCNNEFSSPPSPSPSLCGSPASFDCSPSSYSGRMKDTYEEPAQSISFTDSFLPPASPCRSLDSFSYFAASSPRFSSKSPTLSPSTPDYASSFNFSPSSSNWSDLSYMSSRQPSPSALEASASFTDKPSLLSTPTFSFDHSPRAENTLSPCKISQPSIAERRGSNPPPKILPSLDVPCKGPKNPKLPQSWSISVPEPEDERDKLMLDAATAATSNQSHSESCIHMEDTIDNGSEVRQSVLYHWPTMDELQIHSCDVLDSRSAYMLLAKDGSFKNSCVLYVWLGHILANENWQSKMILSEYINKDGHIHWETIGREFLKCFGFPTDCPLQVVTEGAEPADFRDHVKCFLVSKG